jgi:hypothetical protein
VAFNSKDKDYFKFKIGDIVVEDGAFIFWEDEPLLGIIIDVKRHVYFLGQPDFEIYQDQLTIHWFKIDKIEHVPSDLVNLFSRGNKK